MPIYSSEFRRPRVYGALDNSGMDLPFFYANNPWSYYYPLPRPRNCFPSASRGRVYEEPEPSRYHQRPCTTNTSTRPPTRAPSNSSTSSKSSARHVRSSRNQPSQNQSSQNKSSRNHSNPKQSQRSQQQAMQAQPSTSSSPIPWSARTSDERPAVSFERAAREFSKALEAATDYIKPIYDSFKQDTKEISRYADQAAMDLLWAKKLVAKHDANYNNRGNQSNNHTDDTEEAEQERCRLTFKDHQIAIYNRCEDMLGAESPLWRSSTEDGPSAHRDTEQDVRALMQKMARAREDLFPALRGMGRHWAMAGTALKEMKVLQGNLKTYGEVWDPDHQPE